MDDDIPWYEEEGVMEEFIGFLMSAGFIKKDNADEVIQDIIDNPEEYTGVYNLFRKDITGELEDTTNGGSNSKYLTDTPPDEEYEDFALFRKYFLRTDIT